MLKPKVKIIGTGGTISGGIDLSTGASISLGAEDLISLIPGITEISDIEYEDFCRISSSDMTPELAFSLAQRINIILKNDPELSGIVVTHGTNTLEETAFLSWLLIDDLRPVVFTGAMRAPRYTDSDGPRNLSNSIKVASSEKSKDKGVMVCFNNEIHSARYVKKTHPIAFESFKSGPYGLIGSIYKREILFFNKPLNRITLEPNKIDSNVDLVRLAIGMGSRYIKASISEKVSGIVVEVYGPGRIPSYIMEPLLEARKQDIVIVIVSRCIEGSIYLDNGLTESGFILSKNIDGLKARLLLCLLVTQYKDPKKIQKFFELISGET